MNNALISAYLKMAQASARLGLHKFRLLRRLYHFSISQLRTRVPAEVVEIEGFKLFLNPADSFIYMEILRNKIWEPAETRLVRETVKPGDVAVDIGANLGYFTLLFSTLVGPEGRVHAFEPEPGNFALLKRNVEANRRENVVLVNKAVSAKTGKERLYISEENAGGHTIYSAGSRESVAVDAVRLDEYFASASSRVDFVKMDIQGAEGAALEGMMPLLRQNGRVKILTEFWPEGLRKSGTGPERFLGLLAAGGFSLYDLKAGRDEMARTGVPDLLAAYGPGGGGAGKFTNLFCARENPGAGPA